MDSEIFPKRLEDPRKWDVHDYNELERLINSKKPIIKNKVPNRNEICPCGSRLKYKKCCMEINTTITEKL